MADRPVTPSAPKLRTVLALLALNVDTVVHIDQLVEELWEHDPPGSPLTTLQTYVYQLRKLLVNTDAGLVTRSQGYELRLDQGCEVDVRTFDKLLQHGRSSLDAGQVADAAETLREALAQWRGPAFGGVVTGPVLSARATHLEESRKSALELRFEADLLLGRHHRVVDELAGVVKAQPTHEGFSAKLMTALYRCGRRVEALEVFGRLRSEFVTQFGLEPSAAINRLHQSVLTDDPALNLPEPAARPAVQLVEEPAEPCSSALAQVPPAPFHLVGRQAQLDALVELIGGAHDDRPGLRMAEVAGMPGVGKTALVIAAAHRVRRSYPDGQVFVDLRPVNNGDSGLAAVLAGAMRAAGVPMPAEDVGLAELAYAFRSWSAERRVLVVVDDVMSPDQLDCLHPSGTGSALLVASRRRLHSHGATMVIELPPLSTADGVRMLAEVIGEPRVRQEWDTAAELVRMCRGLPLVIRAMGGRLAYRQGWTLARMLYRLESDPGIVVRLSAGGATLRDTLLGNYRSLPPRARAACQAVAARGHGPFDAVSVADVAEPDELLEALADAYLIEEVVDGGSHASYRVPDLVRLLGPEVTGQVPQQAGSFLQNGFSPSPRRPGTVVLDSEDAVVDHGPAGCSIRS